MDLPHYYKINKFLLTCIGQWPFQTRLSSRVAVGVLVSLSLSQIGPAIAAGVKYRHEMVVLVDCITAYLMIIAYYTKLMSYIINSEKISKMMNFMIEDWKIWAQDEEITVFHEYGKLGERFIVTYTAGFYFAITAYLLQPLILKIIRDPMNNGTSPGDFPYPVYYYQLDERKYYYYIAGYAFVASIAYLSIIVACDTMFIAFVQHNCAIFAALGQKLQRIGQNSGKPDGRDADFEALTICIARHNHALEFAELIESTYTFNFFIILGFNMFDMSFTGLQIITTVNSPQEILKYIVCIQFLMVHLFIECYFSQNLLDHSIRIRENVFCGKWYNAPLKTQALLCLIILRCSKPSRLTAGKICDMSLQTFLGIVKTSMSYLTLLRSVQS